MNGTKSFDVIMAGGGIMGCATAYYLMLQDPDSESRHRRDGAELRTQLQHTFRWQYPFAIQHQGKYPDLEIRAGKAKNLQ